MIYTSKFNKKTVRAINNLVIKLKWSSECADYLIACIKLLSDFNSKLLLRRQCVGYLLINLDRWKSAKISMVQVQRMTPDEQIESLASILDTDCKTLDDVIDTVFNLPRKSTDEQSMLNTSLQYVPEYKGKWITKGMVKITLKEILINGREMA